MATLRTETPTTSFFSSPSHTFKKLVNAFPKSQKQIHHPQLQQQRQQQGHQQQQKQQKLVEEEEEEDNEDDGEADAAQLFHGLADENEVCDDEGEQKQDSSTAAEDAADDIEYSGSSDGEYPRPRIREDLLPHDFSAWQKPPCIAPYPPSEASSTSKEAESFSEVLSSSTSQERHLRINGLLKIKRNPSPNRRAAMDSSPIADLRLHKARQNLPDLKLDHGLSAARGGSRYGGATGLKSLPEDWKSLCNGAFEDGRGSSVDGSRQRRKGDSAVDGVRLREVMQDLARTSNGGEIYQNLVEMFPLIETFMEHPEDNCQHGNFQHHASMVYTRAPSREALTKKVADGANTSRRASRNTRRVKKKDDAVWEEQKNLPRRVKADDSSSSPRRVSYVNAVDIAKLQDQVEELQRKLDVREGMLESYYRSEEPEDENSEVMVLARRVEELKVEVAEKEHMWESARDELAQKENEIWSMKSLLQSTEGSCVGLRARSASNEEEVRALRWEIAALRWEMEIDAEREVSNDTKSQCDAVGKQQQESDVRDLEAVRKMYLAAIVVARHVPREECLVLVGVLRIQLQCFLRRPTFHVS